MAIAYCDGAEGRIAEILEAADDLSADAMNAFESYSDWPTRYHLSPERANLLRHLSFEGLDVLELGAGMGGVSRFMAENARRFVAVEGAEDRASVLRTRLRDLDNWEVHVANLQDFQTPERFDVVCMIGVLEYSELYVKPPAGMSPYEWTIRHAASFLKPGGRVVLAIENRNGVKYWAGAPEDHTGRMFDGICGYGTDKTPRTFSRKVLLDHLSRAGLTEVDEFFPWPDYKTPNSVISKDLIDRFPFFAADIAADATAHERQLMDSYFPWTLALREVARSGLLAELANSFLVVAGSGGRSEISTRLLGRTVRDGEHGWHYSILRKEPIRTAFRVGQGDEAAPTVHKTRIDERRNPIGYKRVLWKPTQGLPALLSQTVLMELRRSANADDRAGFTTDLLRFARWAMEEYKVDAGHLAPAALDLTPSNAVVVEGGFKPFDLEWQLNEPLRKSWFIFRNLFVVRDSLRLFTSPPAATFGEYYLRLCAELGVAPDLMKDIDREAEVQADIQRNTTFESARDMLRAMFGEPWRPAPFPRDPAVEGRLRGLRRDRSLLHRALRVSKSPKALAAAIGRRLARLASKAMGGNRV